MSPLQIAQRLACTALPENEAALRNLLDGLPVGAYTCDAMGKITCYNKRAVELWGRAPRLNDAQERYCGSFRLYAIDGAPISHDRCWMALALQDGKPYNSREIVIERPDGQHVTARAHANPIRGADGELRGALNVLVGIAEVEAEDDALEIATRRDERGSASPNSDLVARLSAVPAAEAPERAETCEVDASGPALRILVVDDNVDSALTMAALLEMQGHQARSAHDGLEALDELDSFRPNVVILDIGMPRMNGYTAAMRIRERMHDAPPLLIALTGWGQPEYRERSKAAGFDHHLVKPVDPVLLFEILASSAERMLH
jgi:CheY-like chemotaxis protein